MAELEENLDPFISGTVMSLKTSSTYKSVEIMVMEAVPPQTGYRGLTRGRQMRQSIVI